MYKKFTQCKIKNYMQNANVYFKLHKTWKLKLKEFYVFWK